MGYGIAKEYEGNGLAFNMCNTAIDYALHTLKLHRIMANYMPSNLRLEKLLNRLGFVKEGLAHEYLKIAGKWEDHVLKSLTSKQCASHRKYRTKRCYVF